LQKKRQQCSIVVIVMRSSAAMISDLDLTELAKAVGLDETVALRPGQFLFREGDEGDALYIVKSGTLRVVRGDAVLETLRAGSIVGEMAIIDEHERSAAVIAGTHAELLRVDEQKFLSLIEHTPRFALIVMRVMSSRLRIMNERYRIRATETATARPSRGS
jgi:CRP/FNR family transcriptional regulator, cyclic AMP receptor protein